MTKQRQISFSVSKEDAKIIEDIVTRAREIAYRLGAEFDQMKTYMDITACHANGTPLKLQALMDADDFNFVHDVFGISRHMDRDSKSFTCGQCINGFHPRFALN